MRPGRPLLRIVGRVLSIAALLAGLTLSAAWGALALLNQAPVGVTGRLVAAGAWVLATILVAVFFLRAPWGRAIRIYAAMLGALVLWWASILPSNERDWEPEVAQMTQGRVDGSIATLASVRNFDWRSETDFTPRWEERAYDLDRLEAVDMILSYWGNPKIAHTLVSFGFSDGARVVFSVEIRKERGESYSEVGGFFKRFETSVVASDERDVVRVRTNVRGEDVYLYRVKMTPAAMRSLFLAYVEEANGLVAEPRFYNTITANCTTIVYKMVDRIVEGLPLDTRLIFSGLLPGYVRDVGGLVSDLPLAEVTAAGRITQRAIAADGAADFSARIREGVPGYQSISR